MENKKIIVYTGIFGLPDENAAGKRVYGVALILEKLGYKVLLIGVSKIIDSRNEKRLTDNIFYCSFPKYKRADVYSSFKYLTNKIRGLSHMPLMIIRYASPSLALFDECLNRYAKKNNIPVVADAVDWLPANGNNFLFNIIKSTDTYLEKAIFNKRGAGVIAISSYLEKYYKSYGLKTIVIPPIVGEYHENNTVNKKTKIIYAGIPFRLNQQVRDVHKIKDRVDLIIDSICELGKRRHDFELHIYGITEKDFLIAFPSYKSRLNNSDDVVFFHGMTDMNFVQEEISKADYTILLRERIRATLAGFPTKVVESISCGTPVITTNTSDLKKYIQSDSTGFIIDISEREKMISQISQILDLDEKSRRSMKRNCYRSQQFLPDKFTDKMQAFISEITKK